MISQESTFLVDDGVAQSNDIRKDTSQQAQRSPISSPSSAKRRGSPLNLGGRSVIPLPVANLSLRTSTSLFTSTALHQHLEVERLVDAATAPVKPRNPRLFDEDPLVDRRAGHARPVPMALAPLSPLRAPLSSEHRLEHDSSSSNGGKAVAVVETYSGRREWVQIPSGAASTLLVQVPPVSDVISAARAAWGDVSSSSTGNPRTLGDEKQQQMRWLRMLRDASALTVVSRRIAAREAETNNNSQDDSSTVVVDLRWIAAFFGLDDHPSNSTPPATATHAVAHTVTFLDGKADFADTASHHHSDKSCGVLPLASKKSTAGVTSVSVMSSGDVFATACLGSVSGGGSEAVGIPSITEEALVVYVEQLQAAATPHAWQSEGAGCGASSASSFRIALAALLSARSATSVNFLLPVLSSVTTATGQSKHPASAACVLVPYDLEGFAVVSDGMSTMWRVGGFVSRVKRDTRSSHLPINQSTSSSAAYGGGGGHGAFVYCREVSALTFTRRSKRGVAALATATASLVPMKSTTVPGLSFHSAAVANPAVGTRMEAVGRGDATVTTLKVICFGGFLDCVMKPQEDAFHAAGGGGNGGVKSTVPASTATANQQSCERFDGVAAQYRYGWQSCTVEALSYNTTAGAKCVIPTAFNGDMLDVMEQRRLAALRSMGGSRWEVAAGGGAGGAPKEDVVCLRCTDAVWLFRPHDGSWSHQVCVGTIPPPRAHHAAAVCGHWMVVAGGIGHNGILCQDVYALHTEQWVWARIETTPCPLGLHPLLLTSLASLLLIPVVPVDASAMEPSSSATVEVYECDITALLRAADARRRQMVGAMRQRGFDNAHVVIPSAAAVATDSALHEASAGSGVGMRLVRNRRQIRATIERLTVMDDATVQAKQALLREQEAAAAEASGEHHPLRTIKRPWSQLAVMSERLDEKGRYEKRFVAAQAFVKERYEAPYPTKLLPPEAIQRHVRSMTTDVLEQWSRKRQDRMRRWERQQTEQRYPPSAHDIRKHDSSYVPPAINAESLAERLLPASSAPGTDERSQLQAKHAAEWEAEKAAVAAKRLMRLEQRLGGKSPLRAPKDASEELYRNESGKQEKIALYEQFVEAPSNRQRGVWWKSP